MKENHATKNHTNTILKAVFLYNLAIIVAWCALVVHGLAQEFHLGMAEKNTSHPGWYARNPITCSGCWPGNTASAAELGREFDHRYEPYFRSFHVRGVLQVCLEFFSEKRTRVHGDCKEIFPNV